MGPMAMEPKGAGPMGPKGPQGLYPPLFKSRVEFSKLLLTRPTFNDPTFTETYFYRGLGPIGEYLNIIKGKYLNIIKGKYLNIIKGKYLNIIKGKYLILENRASWSRNPDAPSPGQNLHEMGRHKRSRGISGGKLHRISPRIFLDRSRPLKLNFFNA